MPNGPGTPPGGDPKTPDPSDWPPEPTDPKEPPSDDNPFGPR